MRRRYKAGWRNFLNLYRPIADEWQVYDNSFAGAVLVAQWRAGGVIDVVDPELAAIIEAGPRSP